MGSLRMNAAIVSADQVNILQQSLLTWAEKIAFMKDMYCAEMSGEACIHRIRAFLCCSLVACLVP